MNHKIPITVGGTAGYVAAPSMFDTMVPFLGIPYSDLVQAFLLFCVAIQLIINIRTIKSWLLKKKDSIQKYKKPHIDN